MNPIPKALKTLSWITSATFAIALYLVFFYAPREAVMGDVQRIFYFHVASFWVAALGFLIAAIAGVLYLSRRTRNWDQVALASIEIGVVFTFINIVSGSIWARPAWNTWWTWDPRLVTATIVELIYFAYIMLRQGIEDPDRRARFAAVYAIVGFISVPITFLSIRYLRTIHPIVIGSANPNAEGGFDMTASMRVAFFFSLITFTFLYATLLWHRLRLEKIGEKVEALKMKILSA